MLTLVFFILTLLAALTYSLGWSLLSIVTLLFFCSYPIIFIAWKTYSFWRTSIMQLTTYTQILAEGEQNIRFKQQNPDNLLCDLQQEIAKLARGNQLKSEKNQTLDNVLSHVLEAWPIPICLFDDNLTLSYRNIAMNEKIQQPMLLGTTAQDLGFELNNDKFSHRQFNHQWQCQSISYLYQGKKSWLFSALDIAQPLHQQQTATQQNLIRVLAHELRNSLTPMSSMADTLLNSEQLDEQQTRLVLDRIRQRSDRLLSFIGQYSQLTQLPTPKCKWFEIKELIAEAKAMTDKNLTIIFRGNEKCYGDIEQVSQILINLFKNAYEASQHENSEITVKVFNAHQEQIIEILTPSVYTFIFLL